MYFEAANGKTGWISRRFPAEVQPLAGSAMMSRS
jgi:hypothetical protein